MKISNDTIDLLKNFSIINQSFLFKPGNTIRTISPQKNIFAEATVSETFPVECAIYELPKFLSIISLFEDPHLDFDETYVTISCGKKKSQSVRYYYAMKNLIVAPPDKSPKMDSIIDEFNMTTDELTKLTKASFILGLPHFVIEAKEGILSSAVMNKNMKGSNSFKHTIGNTNKEDYDVIVNVDKLKMIMSDYDVKVGMTGKHKFINFDGKKVKYFIAAEPRV